MTYYSQGQSDAPESLDGGGRRMFTSMQNEPLPKRVATEIIRGILLGQFVPGDTLPTEERLCEQFGVSRSVIREAMQAVSGVGMTQSRQGRGTIVLDPSEWNDFAPEILEARIAVGADDEFLLKFLELRAIIEPQTALLAAQRADDVDIQKMRVEVDAMDGDPADVEQFIQHDIAFHSAIIASTDNEVISKLFSLLEPMLYAARRRGIQPPEGGPRRDLNVDREEHRKIFEAIAAHDPAEAAHAMTDHLRWVVSRDTRQELARPRPEVTAE